MSIEEKIKFAKPSYWLMPLPQKVKLITKRLLCKHDYIYSDTRRYRKCINCGKVDKLNEQLENE